MPARRHLLGNLVALGALAGCTGSTADTSAPQNNSVIATATTTNPAPKPDPTAWPDSTLVEPDDIRDQPPAPTMPTASTVTPAPPNVVRRAVLTEPVHSISIIGDSLLYDSSILGGRKNTIVDAIDASLQATSGLGDISVRNDARPGMGVHHAITFESGQVPTLKNHIRAVFDSPEKFPDLVIIAASGIDLNLLFDRPVAEVARDVITTLDDVVADFEANGVQVVIMPVLGVNSTLHDVHQRAVRPDAPPSDANGRIHQLNGLMASSGLPMLFTEFTGMDFDDDGVPDEAFFINHDDRPGRIGVIDDGLHPNNDGEVVYIENVLKALIPVLFRANSGIDHSRVD